MKSELKEFSNFDKNEDPSHASIIPILKMSSHILTCVEIYALGHCGYGYFNIHRNDSSSYINK